MRNMAVQTKGVLLSGFLLILTTIITTACGSTEPDHLSGGEPRGGQIPSETSAPEDSSSPAITTPTLSLREGSEGTSAPVLTPTPVPAPTSTPTSPAQPTTEVPTWQPQRRKQRSILEKAVCRPTRTTKGHSGTQDSVPAGGIRTSDSTQFLTVR